MATTIFMVRAVLAELADRPRFDRWYAVDHLPQALAAFGAQRGWRAWSRVDPHVHFAFYEFADAAKAESITGSPALTAMIAEFDRVWGERVTRARDFIELAD
jgi:hypothetical protein